MTGPENEMADDRDRRQQDDQPLDLSAVANDDALLDRLGGLPTPPGTAEEPELFEVTAGPAQADPPAAGTGGATEQPTSLETLLRAWREDLTKVPLPDPPPIERVAAAVAAGRRTKRSLRPVVGIAVAICLLLVGSAVFGSRVARPGDALWPVAQAIWPDRADSVAAGEAARLALDEADAAIDGGQPSMAKVALTRASTAIAQVQPRDGRELLQGELESLWTRASAAEAAATTSGPPATTPQPSSPGSPSTGSPSSTPTDGTTAPTSPDGTTGTTTPADPSSPGNAGSPTGSPDPTGTEPSSSTPVTPPPTSETTSTPGGTDGTTSTTPTPPSSPPETSQPTTPPATSTDPSKSAPTSDGTTSAVTPSTPPTSDPPGSTQTSATTTATPDNTGASVSSPGSGTSEALFATTSDDPPEALMDPVTSAAG